MTKDNPGTPSLKHTPSTLKNTPSLKNPTNTPSLKRTLKKRLERLDKGTDSLIKKALDDKLKPKGLLITLANKEQSWISKSLKEKTMGYRIRVENLDPSATESDLLLVFQQFGNCSVCKKNGYSEISFMNKLDAEKCCREMNGQIADGFYS